MRYKRMIFGNFTQKCGSFVWFATIKGICKIHKQCESIKGFIGACILAQSWSKSEFHVQYESYGNSNINNLSSDKPLEVAFF